MTDILVCAVLPAGGCGQRTGMKTPKQYCDVLNRPLVTYTLQAFDRVSWIKHVIIAMHQDYRDVLLDVISTHSLKKVHIVAAGATRHRSIWEGIKSLGKVCPVPDVVVVHDAVRPFVDEDILWKTVEAAKHCGAAGAIRPLVSTVLAVDGDGYLDHSLDRSKYRASEMPQSFQYDIIKTAYEKCTDYDLDYGTECLHLAQRYGGTKVRLIDGPDSLWKVTHKKDIAAAESTIKDLKNKVVLVNCPEGMIPEVRGIFEQQNYMVSCYGGTDSKVPTCGDHFIIFYDSYEEKTILETSERIGILSTHPAVYPVTTVLHVVTCGQQETSQNLDIDYPQALAFIQGLQRNILSSDVCTALLLSPVDSQKQLIRLLLTLVTAQNPILGGQIYNISDGFR